MKKALASAAAIAVAAAALYAFQRNKPADAKVLNLYIWSDYVDKDVLAQFDRHTTIVDVPPKAPVTCADPDDQIFIDLAVAHQAILISKDKAVLTMKKRLAALHVRAGRTLQEVTA